MSDAGVSRPSQSVADQPSFQDVDDRARRRQVELARSRRIRMITGTVLGAVFVVAYILVVISYNSGFDATFT